MREHRAVVATKSERAASVTVRRIRSQAAIFNRPQSARRIANYKLDVAVVFDVFAPANGQHRRRARLDHNRSGSGGGFRGSLRHTARGSRKIRWLPGTADRSTDVVCSELQGVPATAAADGTERAAQDLFNRASPQKNLWPRNTLRPLDNRPHRQASNSATDLFSIKWDRQRECSVEPGSFFRAERPGFASPATWQKRSRRLRVSISGLSQFRRSIP